MAKRKLRRQNGTKPKQPKACTSPLVAAIDELLVFAHDHHVKILTPHELYQFERLDGTVAAECQKAGVALPEKLQSHPHLKFVGEVGLPGNWLRGPTQVIDGKETQIGPGGFSPYFSADWGVRMRSLRAQAEVMANVPKVYYFGDGLLEIRGNPKRLIGQEKEVIEAIVDLRAATKQQLDNRSKVVNAVRVLKNVRTKFQLEEVITLPEHQSQGGYATTIERRQPGDT